MAYRLPQPAPVLCAAAAQHLADLARVCERDPGEAWRYPAEAAAAAQALRGAVAALGVITADVDNYVRRGHRWRTVNGTDPDRARESAREAATDVRRSVREMSAALERLSGHLATLTPPAEPIR
ncbi:hypothetical protein ACFWA9_10330 [Kitasatospora sp. NPDC059973]|uniref:hypothetical protein n=1 Tax=Kitasatospora sp. NPDC059973 TaxID=3347020 RepID=UPI0036A45837